MLDAFFVAIFLGVSILTWGFTLLCDSLLGGQR
jgi:hypothetical protein